MLPFYSGTINYEFVTKTEHYTLHSNNHPFDGVNNRVLCYEDFAAFTMYFLLHPPIIKRVCVSSLFIQLNFYRMLFYACVRLHVSACHL